MKILLIFIFTIFAVSPLLAQWQEGDLIFHQSQSAQGPALSESTHSKWTHVGIIIKNDNHWVVYESIGPVQFTDLNKFIARGKDGKYVVKRVRKDFIDLTQNMNRELLIRELNKFFNFPYDIFFEWSDNKIYCSELVWKGFYNAFGKSPGIVQTLGDLDLSGPSIKRLIEERIKLKKSQINLLEPIITPISIMNSENLEVVFENI